MKARVPITEWQPRPDPVLGLMDAPAPRPSSAAPVVAPDVPAEEATTESHEAPMTRRSSAPETPPPATRKLGIRVFLTMEDLALVRQEQRRREIAEGGTKRGITDASGVVSAAIRKAYGKN